GQGRPRFPEVPPSNSIERAGRHMARAAGLRYVCDAHSGLSRRRRSGGFVYLNADGSKVRSKEEIQRINALAIPPAYVDVWICPDPDGHIQATARDAKGRKQYRYHARWQAIRSATKFERMAAFGDALPRIRRRVSSLLKLDGMPREKVLAAVVQLLDISLIRVGNDEYARRNRSYGLTTLCTRHVKVSGTTMVFEFSGKSGVAHCISVRHPGLASFMKACLEIPGRELFQYLDDDGRRHAVNSSDVNAFLQSIAEDNFTAKDFRTWGASALALRELLKQRADSKANARKLVLEMIKSVAERLGNTPTVCRKSYIHPQVIDAFATGKLSGLRSRARRGLRGHETALLALLQSPAVGAAADSAKQ
ncbi:MAG: hypothetical protein ABI854_06335, partial [Betaproteobacteria bacterium]